MMDRASAILSELNDSSAGLSPGELATRLGISRQAVARHLRSLLAHGLIAKRGKTRNTRYFVTSWRRRYGRELVAPFPDEHTVYSDDVVELVAELPANVTDICRYAFTEMLNNAIDHSRSPGIELEIADNGDALRFVVRDEGIGCFSNVARRANLSTHAEAIAHLSKGKQTTAPEAHSGEGIFFTSKAVDRFTLESDGLIWVVDNLREDVGVGESDVRLGTRVTFELAPSCSRTLQAVFDAYSVEPFAFDRTRIHVKLFERGDAFISRSEAKRLVVGLEPFTEIILDYRGVRIIGQGFADQLYRVYAGSVRDKRLVSINASSPVAMMIRRAGGQIAV